MRSFPVIKGGHDIYSDHKDCRCHYHTYLYSSILLLEHKQRDMPDRKQRRRLLCTRYLKFWLQLTFLFILLFFSWCFTLNIVANYQGEWYKDNELYYLGVTFVAVTYCYFGMQVISIVHNTPLIYLPNLILFVPICCINAVIAILYTKRQSDQFIHSNGTLCKVFQCEDRTFYWIWMDVLSAIVPFCLLLPFFLVLVQTYHYAVRQQHEIANFRAASIEHDINSHELGSPSLPNSNASQSESYTHSMPPSPHVPPTGMRYQFDTNLMDDSLHNAPLGHANNLSDVNLHTHNHVYPPLIDDKLEEESLREQNKSSEIGPASTLLNAGHIVVDRKTRSTKQSLPNTIRTSLKPNRISCCYCMRAICSCSKLYWLFIPPCQDKYNSHKLYACTALYALLILCCFGTQYFIAQLKQDNVQKYFIEIYVIMRLLIFPQKQLMKYVARKIDELRLNFVDEDNILGYNTLGSQEDFQSIPFRDQISFEYFTEYLLVYLYYDTYRYLFVAQSIDPLLFMGTMIIHFMLNFMDNLIRGSKCYHHCTYELQREQQHNGCLGCVSRDLSEHKEWLYRISADINMQFIACAVNAIFWLLVIPSQLDYWKKYYHINVMRAIVYTCISCAVDSVLFVMYFLWYKSQYKVNLLRTFIAIYVRHEWKLVCCVAIISGTLSQKWYFLLENFHALGNSD